MGSPNTPRPSPAGGELSGLLRKAEDLSRELDRAQLALKEEKVEGQDAQGWVRIELTGDGAPARVDVHHPSLSAEVEQALQDSMQAALKLALQRLFDVRRKRLSHVTRGLNLPQLYT